MPTMFIVTELADQAELLRFVEDHDWIEITRGLPSLGKHFGARVLVDEIAADGSDFRIAVICPAVEEIAECPASKTDLEMFSAKLDGRLKVYKGKIDLVSGDS